MGGAIRYHLHDDTYAVQCPTCRRFVPSGVEEFNGVRPLARHSRWRASVVQDSFQRWPYGLRRRWTLRFALRVEWLMRTLNPAGEPVCEDVTPRVYREWLPTGCPQEGPR